MNCPYCGKPMEEGVIQCRDGIYWTAKTRPVAALPIGGGQRIDLSDGGDSGVFSGHKATALCCKDCKKIVLAYQD